MSIELPGEVVWIMDLMGLEWPDIDEDELRAWGGHVREFGQNLAEGHSGLDATLKGLADAYEGASYDALLSRWNQVSGEHHTALTNCCEVLATALEVAATGVVVAKGVVIAQLVITAVEMAAAAAATVATLGIAAAAEAAAIEIGKRIIREVIQEIEDVLIAELVSMAIEPFQAEIEKAVSGLVFKGVDAALGAAGGCGVSKGFRAHPDSLAKAAKDAHGHAEKVERFSSNLDSKTRGRLLGKGRFGLIVEKAVRPIIDSMITDMSKAMARGHRSIGHGLEITKKNIDDAEEAIRKDLRRHQDERDAVHLKLGQRVLNEEDLRDKYKKRVGERVDDLRRQGHGPQRHLDPTDDMLKDRLGTPTGPKDANGDLLKDDEGNPRIARQGGYVQTENKIDPVHGPNAKERLGGDAYLDAETGKKHKCDSFSTAFKDDRGEAFMYADEHARGRIDGDRTRMPNSNRHEVVFSPEDAWGPGDHSQRFRGFYIDPENPMNSDKSINYKPVDFQHAKIKAIYAPDGNGGHKLVTMFPEPVKIFNR